MGELTNKELAQYMRLSASASKTMWERQKLEIAAERLDGLPDKEAIKKAYEAGFIQACGWPEPVSQDVDSEAFSLVFDAWLKNQGRCSKISDYDELQKAIESAEKLILETDK